VFQLQPPSSSGGTWTSTSIYNFLSSGDSDGIGPGGVIFGPDGSLYGITGGGGTNGVGTLFKLIPPATSGGSWKEKILYNFASDQANPIGNLILGPKGSFFGIALSGTAHAGSIFQLIPPSEGTGWTESVLYNFAGGSDGAYPAGGLVRDPLGNLYGVTGGGGGSASNCLSSGCGTLFELSPPATSGGSWTKVTLHSFAGGRDGGNPTNSLLLYRGALLGTTAYGGTPNDGTGGTVFRFNF
jgi:hypothetical protein